MDYQYYTEYEEGVSQYEDVEFKLGECVLARYIPATLPCDRGNPLIEALPPLRDQQMLTEAYTRHMPEYDFDSIKDMTQYQKIMQIRLIRKLRFPMPFHKQLELEFYTLMISSYRARMVMGAQVNPVQYIAGNTMHTSSQVLVGDQSESTGAGIVLTGYSGCGKSSAVHCMVSDIPKYILHEKCNGYFPQIPYLVVNCVPGSNFSALYINIAEALDQTLGNIDPVYALEIEKTKTLGVKAQKICTLIERFAIGVLIFDEVQYIDFHQGQENSFDSLLTITNKTKVGIMVVGTEEARDKMFSRLRIARRLGCTINGNTYCSNRPYFHLLLTHLFRYQWFDEPVILTSELESALYEVTKGIVDQLISTYMCMNLEFVQRKKKPQINGEFIHDVAEKYYPGIQQLLQDIEDPDIDEMLKRQRQNVEQLFDDYRDSDSEQSKEAERLINESPDADRKYMQLRSVISAISALFDYTPSQIEEAYNKVMRRKTAKDKSEREICQMVLEVLNQQPKEKIKKSNSKLPVEKMKSFLE